jgi:hypothetical protein
MDEVCWNAASANVIRCPRLPRTSAVHSAPALLVRTETARHPALAGDFRVLPGHRVPPFADNQRRLSRFEVIRRSGGQFSRMSPFVFGGAALNGFGALVVGPAALICSRPAGASMLAGDRILRGHRMPLQTDARLMSLAGGKRLVVSCFGTRHRLPMVGMDAGPDGAEASEPVTVQDGAAFARTPPAAPGANLAAFSPCHSLAPTMSAAESSTG